MIATIVIIFVLGYTAIVLEHPLKLDKTVPAIFTGALLWAIISFSGLGVVTADHQAGELEGVLLHQVDWGHGNCGTRGPTPGLFGHHEPYPHHQ
jgi:hypothetical protein